MSHAAAVGFSLGEAELRDVRRRAILSCAIGNFFELFDFTIYGCFAVAISRAYFPVGNATFAMLSTFGAFAVAFLMRPVGAIVLGAYGDKVGRRAALVVTIGMMATATGLTGIIPPYATIGVWAPILLLLCRMVQGFSTGGEWGGAAAFLVEYSSPGKRGLTGSWQQFSTQIGALSGSISAALLATMLSQEQSIAGAGAFPSSSASCSARSAITCASASPKPRPSSRSSKPARWNTHRCASPLPNMARGWCRPSASASSAASAASCS